MSKKLKNILGLMVLVVALAACSKDPELYSPQSSSVVQERPTPSALPVDPNAGDSSGSGGASGGSGVFNSNSGRPVPAPAVGGSNGTVSISDDDDDEDDDDSTN